MLFQWDRHGHVSLIEQTEFYSRRPAAKRTASERNGERADIDAWIAQSYLHRTLAQNRSQG